MHPTRRSLASLTMAVTAAIPAGMTWGGLSAHAAPALKSKTQKFKGPLVDMRWGPVRATIWVKSKKITKVAIETNPDSDRSQMLDDMSVPILKEETLQAQSAKVDEVSGATMTSDAYIESLHAAIKSAKKHRAL